MPEPALNFRQKGLAKGHNSVTSKRATLLNSAARPCKSEVWRQNPSINGDLRMSASCCDHEGQDLHRGDPRYRRVLWAVLAINASMFLVEIVAGLAAGSASLQADAMDFLGDAGNYAISLFVVGMALRYRAMAAFLKGATMAVFGLWVAGITAWHMWHGTVPEAATMGVVGTTALLANALSFGLLWAFRGGDSNMRSAWICTRNDVIGNLAVLLAALGVFGTGTGWPDVIVAAIMAALALQGAVLILGHSLSELRSPASARQIV
jgi:Co/Zn/Cd efflux system component